jgi:hypothetical protein
MDQKEKKRRTNNKTKVLLALQRPDGATNVQLNDICFRYGARLYDLRKEGWKIKTENEGDGIFRFRITAKPTAESQGALFNARG